MRTRQYATGPVFICCIDATCRFAVSPQASPRRGARQASCHSRVFVIDSPEQPAPPLIGPGLRSSALVGLPRALATGGSVISYHGIGENSPGSTMHVPVERFVATIRALKRVATFVPLRELVSWHLHRKPTRGLVALTFDDAYASVLTEVRGVVEGEAVPATVFVIQAAARRAPCGRSDSGSWRSTVGYGLRGSRMPSRESSPRLVAAPPNVH
jgi:hypothetical protein